MYKYSNNKTHQNLKTKNVMMTHKKNTRYYLNIYYCFLCHYFETIFSSTVTNYSTTCTSSYVSAYHISEFLTEIKRMSYINAYSNIKKLMEDEKQLNYSYKILNESLEKEAFGEKEGVKLAEKISTAILNYKIFMHEILTNSEQNIFIVLENLIDEMSEIIKSLKIIDETFNNLENYERELIELIEERCKVTDRIVFEFKKTFKRFLSNKVQNPKKIYREKIFNDLQNEIITIISEHLSMKSIINQRSPEIFRKEIVNNIKNAFKNKKDIYVNDQFFFEEISKVLDPFFNLLITIQQTSLKMTVEYRILVHLKANNYNILMKTNETLNQIIKILRKNFAILYEQNKNLEKQIRIMHLKNLKTDKNRTNIIIKEVIKQIKEEYYADFKHFEEKYEKNLVEMNETCGYDENVIKDIEIDCNLILEKKEIEKKIVFFINETLDEDTIIEEIKNKMTLKAKKVKTKFYKICNKILRKGVNYLLIQYIDQNIKNYNKINSETELNFFLQKFKKDKEVIEKMDFFVKDLTFLVGDINNKNDALEYKLINTPSEENRQKKLIKAKAPIKQEKRLKIKKTTESYKITLIFCVITLLFHFLATYNEYF